MSLLESLSDPNRHSKQPNSFAAVQTTWNKSGAKAPKPQTNSESRATVAAGSSGKKSSHEFQKEISRLDKKITKVATTVGTLYNQINLLIEKQNKTVDGIYINSYESMNVIRCLRVYSQPSSQT